MVSTSITSACVPCGSGGKDNSQSGACEVSEPFPEKTAPACEAESTVWQGLQQGDKGMNARVVEAVIQRLISRSPLGL